MPLKAVVAIDFTILVDHLKTSRIAHIVKCLTVKGGSVGDRTTALLNKWIIMFAAKDKENGSEGHPEEEEKKEKADKQMHKDRLVQFIISKETTSKDPPASSSLTNFSITSNNWKSTVVTLR